MQYTLFYKITFYFLVQKDFYPRLPLPPGDEHVCTLWFASDGIEIPALLQMPEQVTTQLQPQGPAAAQLTQPPAPEPETAPPAEEEDAPPSAAADGGGGADVWE